MAERNNAFGNLAGEFPPKAPEAKQEPRIDRKIVDEIAEANDFRSQVSPKPQAKAPTTAPRRRRNVTGRNQQINIKATAETIEELYAMADRKRVTLGQLLEDALAALKKTSY